MAGRGTNMYVSELLDYLVWLIKSRGSTEAGHISECVSVTLVCNRVMITYGIVTTFCDWIQVDSLYTMCFYSLNSFEIGCIPSRFMLLVFVMFTWYMSPLYICMCSDVANNVLTRLPNGGDFEDMIVQYYMDFSNNRLVFLERNTFVNLTVNGDMWVVCHILI